MENKKHIVAITAFIKNPEGNKFLVLKRSEDEIAFPGKWAFPGGKVEKGQSILETLKREVLEEAGLEIEEKKEFLKDFTFIRPDSHNVVGMCFSVKAKKGEVKIPKDFTDWRWVTPEEFKELNSIEGMEEEVKLAFEEEYKEETLNAYETFPELFAERFEKSFKNVKEYADYFISSLKGEKILDLGSGSGNHAKYFKDRGFDIHCIDISPAMIRLCKEKGLSAEVMDMEELQIEEKSYDGIWAYASLLHIPKEKLAKIIPTIINGLKPEGLLGMSFKEGQEEEYETNPDFPGVRRWFRHYTEEEIRKLFGEHFEIEPLGKTKKDKHTFLNYQLKKKSHHTHS